MEDSDGEGSIVEACPISQPVSLLLLDQVMPTTNGFQVAQQVLSMFNTFQENNKSANIIRPIIVLVSQFEYDMTTAKVLSEQQCADLFLEKPIDAK